MAVVVESKCDHFIKPCHCCPLHCLKSLLYAPFSSLYIFLLVSGEFTLSITCQVTRCYLSLFFFFLSNIDCLNDVSF